ncbi:MAG: TcpQ domain-containing protein [Methylophilaceae bacterium]|nr:TcpQ domain-containing protein [Methylophilaceae bacterium]
MRFLCYVFFFVFAMNGYTAEEVKIDISFPLGQSELDRETIARFQEYLPALQASEVILVDSLADKNEINTQLPFKRAQRVKIALIKLGLPDQKILINVNSTISSSLPLITIRTKNQVRTQDTLLLSQVGDSDASKIPNIRFVKVSDETVPILAVRKILKTAMEDNLSASATSRLFELMLDLRGTSKVLPFAKPKPTKTIVVDNDVKTWRLDEKRTLRENIQDWATTAGWKDTLEWKATEYSVGTTTFLDGKFPDILKQISDSADLNVCVTNAPRRIRITNQGIDCKD